MRLHDGWEESKYALANGRLRATLDPFQLAPASRIAAQLVADFYTTEIPLHAKGRLLDLGCGKAPMLGLYRHHVSSILCADWPNSLHSNPNTDVYCDLSKPLPFNDSSFDTILLSDVLEHIPDPAGLWMQMSRILSRNGKVIGNAPFMYWIHEAPYDFQRMTPFAIGMHAAEAGLRIEFLEKLGSELDTWTDLTSKVMSRLPGVGAFASTCVRAFTSPVRNLSRMRESAKNNPMPLSIGFVAEKP